ncbi:MAG: DUF6465 family protein [Saccharofermentans sp.]|nr:DUF6465 family protein [Saccharofermentans sp.]
MTTVEKKAEVKVAEKAPVAAKKVEKKPVAKKAAAEKKPVEKKVAAEKKPVEKKAAPAKKVAAKKPAAKKAAKKVAIAPKTFVIQAGENEITYAEIVKKVNKAVEAGAKKLDIYVKPEDNKAYFVSDKNTGAVDLF